MRAADAPEPGAIPITGELVLHAFREGQAVLDAKARQLVSGQATCLCSLLPGRLQGGAKGCLIRSRWR